MTTTHEFDEWSDLEARWACNDPMQEAMDYELNARYDRYDGYGDIDYAAEQEYYDSKDRAADNGIPGVRDGIACMDGSESNVGSDLAGMAGKTGPADYSEEDIPF